MSHSIRVISGKNIIPTFQLGKKIPKPKSQSDPEVRLLQFILGKKGLKIRFNISVYTTYVSAIKD